MVFLGFIWFIGSVGFVGLVGFLPLITRVMCWPRKAPCELACLALTSRGPSVSGRV